MAATTDADVTLGLVTIESCRISKVDCLHVGNERKERKEKKRKEKKRKRSLRREAFNLGIAQTAQRVATKSLVVGTDCYCMQNAEA